MSPRIFACAVCGQIVRGKHAQALTCSPRCRVWWHRHPLAQLKLRLEAADRHISFPDFLEQRALARVHPDLAERVTTGSLTLIAARRLMLVRALRRASTKENVTTNHG